MKSRFMFLNSTTRKMNNITYQDMENLESLSKEMAREIVDTNFTEIKFLSLASLSSRAAAILAETSALIEFPCLETITADAAEALSAHRGILRLNGITELLEDSAAALALHEGRLSLPAITSLRVEVARALSSHTGGLSLTGLRTISMDVAAALAEYGAELDLSELTELSDGAAKSLSNHNGILKLNGLTSLSDASAEFLAKHRGGLYLDGIYKLTPAVVESLVEHHAFLSLNGISQVDSGIAELIIHHRNPIILQGLTNLSSENIETLLWRSEDNIILDLDVVRVLECVLAAKTGNSDSQVRLASYFENGGTVRQDLTMAAQWYRMASTQGGIVSRLKAVAIEEEIAEGLLDYSEARDPYENPLDLEEGFDGDLDLSDLKDLSVREAEILAKCSNRIYLDGLKNISEIAAQALARHSSELSLGGLLTISESAAKSIAQHEAKVSLNGLKDISAKAAKHLLTNPHVVTEIDLRSYVEPSSIDASVAIRFLREPEDVDLSKAFEISEDAAELLAECSHDLLLDGLMEISDGTAKALSHHNKKLTLNGIVEISDTAHNFLADYRCDLETSSLIITSDAALRSLAKRNEEMRKLRGEPPEGFALIPKGIFEMGDSTPIPKLTLFDRFLNVQVETRNIHPVDLSAFYMAKYETTKALWDKVRNWGLVNGYQDLLDGTGRGDDFPVLKIAWYASVKWCNAFSEMKFLNPCYTANGRVYREGDCDYVVCDWTASGYRLPTEAEWEKAARGGLRRLRFPWGNQISHSNANYYSKAGDDLYDDDISPTKEYHPTYKNSPYQQGVDSNWTSPVGSFPANNYGIYDMSGNIAEWCFDMYDEAYYASSPVDDPRGPSVNNCSEICRVCRGGYFGSSSYSCRVYNRDKKPPSCNRGAIGFRVARSVVS